MKIVNRKSPIASLLAIFTTGLCLATVQADDALKKAPIPDEKSLANSYALLLDIFKEDIVAATDAEKKSKLAALLLQQGKENRDDAANRYVLLREAWQWAAKAGDVNLTLAAVDELSRDFAINPLQLKSQALAALAENSASPQTAKAVVDLVLPLINAAVDGDDYQTAIALGKIAETSARRARAVALVTVVQKHNEEVQAIYKGFARLQTYVDRLKKDHEDRQANLEMGRYYGALKGRWEKALPLLAKGGDEKLAALAAKDLSHPENKEGRVSLADGWWDLGATLGEPAQMQLQRRAAYWYEQALGTLTGLNRTKALKRMEKVSARLNGTRTGGDTSGPVGELKKFEGHNDEVKGVALSPDGRYAVSGGLDQTVRIWDLAGGKEDKILRGHGKQVWSVAFHPNGRQVFSVSWDATARLWDIKTGSEVRRYIHRLDVNGLAVARDGNSFLTGCDDHNVYLWDTAASDEIRRFAGHTGFVYAVAFSPDGRQVASGGVDKTVRLFELATGSQLKLLEGSQNAVTNIAFSPDSRFLFSSGDPVIHVWDLSTGKEVRKFEGHAGLVQAMALSPDGRRLLTGGDDKTIRLWDAAGGKELHKFQGHTDHVTCVRFSSDGRQAISGSLDRTVRIWGLPGR